MDNGASIARNLPTEIPRAETPGDADGDEDFGNSTLSAEPSVYYPGAGLAEHLGEFPVHRSCLTERTRTSEDQLDNQGEQSSRASAGLQDTSGESTGGLRAARNHIGPEIYDGDGEESLNLLSHRDIEKAYSTRDAQFNDSDFDIQDRGSPAGNDQQSNHQAWRASDCSTTPAPSKDHFSIGNHECAQPSILHGLDHDACADPCSRYAMRHTVNLDLRRPAADNSSSEDLRNDDRERGSCDDREGVLLLSDNSTELTSLKGSKLLDSENEESAIWGPSSGDAQVGRGQRTPQAIETSVWTFPSLLSNTDCSPSVTHVHILL